MRLAEENMLATHHHQNHMNAHAHHQGATHHHHAHAQSLMHSMSVAIPNGHSMMPTEHDMSRKYCISPKLMEEHQSNMTLNLVKTEVTPLHYFGGHLDHTVASM